MRRVRHVSEVVSGEWKTCGLTVLVFEGAGSLDLYASSHKTSILHLDSRPRGKFVTRMGRDGRAVQSQGGKQAL